jgi:hypothetical protein
MIDNLLVTEFNFAIFNSREVVLYCRKYYVINQKKVINWLKINIYFEKRKILVLLILICFFAYKLLKIENSRNWFIFQYKEYISIK